MFLRLLLAEATQGNDHGTQYRSGIYYHSEEQRQAALEYIKEAQKGYSQPIVTEVSNYRQSIAAPHRQLCRSNRA